MNPTRTFSDLGSFALHLAERELALRSSLSAGMERALTIIENDAKEQIGHYQPEAGHFPAWAPLAASTEAEKSRIGAPADAPLLRHGGLYASFGHEVVSPTEGVVGSTDPTMVFHEFGTSKMPPRPVLGPAMLKNMPRVQQILGQFLVEGIVGGELSASGGYFGDSITP